MPIELNNPVLPMELPGIDAGKGMTFAAVFRDTPKRSGVFLFQAGHVVFAHEGAKLYANYQAADGRWMSFMVSKDVLPDDGKYHHAALVIGHHHVGSQGEDWTDGKLYLDGVPVCGIRYDKSFPVPSDAPLTIGKGRSLSGEHGFDGEIAKIRSFDKMFTESEIRDLVLSEPMVTPGFRVFPPLTNEEKSLLDSENDPVIRQAKLTISQGSYSLIFDWKSVELIKLDSVDSTLVIARNSTHTIPVSWYDRKTGRELLSPENCWYRFALQKNTEKTFFTALSENLTSSFASEPVRAADGCWNFKISFNSLTTPDFSGETNWSFAADCIKFDLDIQDKSEGFLLRDVNFPLVSTAVLDHGCDTMLVPQMSGMEMPDAVKRNVSYTSPYPRGNCSLQMGAYYDQESGVYCGVGDPVARAKEFNFNAGSSGCVFSFDWKTPYDADRKPNRYQSLSFARIELFRGNWFEAGQIYRQQLIDSGAWWFVPRSDDPADHPEWMWNNTLWLRIDLAYHPLAAISPALKKLREYLELPLALHVYDWYERGSWLSPMVKASPEFIEDVADLRKYDIRTVPYTTARIWQTPDRRGKDYLYEKVAVPNAVIDEDGSLAVEMYGLPTAVLCPHTETYMKYQYEMTTKIAEYGLDGVYADQIGAARPRPCYSDKHGHRIGEDNWFKDGHYPVYSKIRDFWRKHSPDMVLTTEDNAEHCVALFHGLLNWRWMLDGQVPLFTEVYAGHTQFIGLDGVGEEPEAAFPKVSTQFTNGEQLGWFQHHKITSPVRGEFRKFVKMLMHLRFALLDFFNLGNMDKPVTLIPGVPKISRFWGRQGTYYVSTAAVQTTCWSYGNIEVTVLVNNTSEKRSGKVKLNAFDHARDLTVYFMNGQSCQCAYPADSTLDYELKPHCAIVFYSYPAGKKPLDQFAKMEKALEVIARIPQEKDPFAVTPDELPATETFRADDWVSQPLPIGKLSTEMSYELSAFGTVNMDNVIAVEAVFDAPVERPVGFVTLRMDSLDKENILATFDVPKAYPPLTRSIGEVTLKIDLEQKISGDHRIFFLLSECSHCELKKWRFIYA